ncbi:MAG TPA: hypothetical protein VGY55_02335 [Pirellulales bacterium]|nr:hypothetical protein [Pirellulales bacterium]
MKPRFATSVVSTDAPNCRENPPSGVNTDVIRGSSVIRSGDGTETF